VELCLDLYPGKTLHGKVDAVIRATGEGQLAVTGALPTTGQKGPAARIPVRIAIDEADRERYPAPAAPPLSTRIAAPASKSFAV
jgi:multidrug resistance efflux pump